MILLLSLSMMFARIIYVVVCFATSSLFMAEWYFILWILLNIHWKDWCWVWNSSSNTLATWWEDWLIRKDPDAWKDWRQEEKGMTEDEMVGWHHQLNAHEFEQALGDGDGQGSLVWCRPWGHKESDTTEWLNNNNNNEYNTFCLLAWQ